MANNFESKYRFYHRFVRFIPIVFFIMNLIFPYILLANSIYLGHCDPFLPYVSDLGLIPPNASYFSMCLGLIGAFGVLFALFRYRFSKYHLLNLNNLENDINLKLNRDNDIENDNNDINYELSNNNRANNNLNIFKNQQQQQQNYDKVADASLITGLTIAFFAIGVGSFRNGETLFTLVIHNIVASLLFFTAFIDIVIETRTAKLIGSKFLFRFRFVSAVFYFISYNICAISLFTSFILNIDALKDFNLRLFWPSDAPGYVWHLFSTFFEWVALGILSFHFLSYHELFKTPIKSR